MKAVRLRFNVPAWSLRILLPALYGDDDWFKACFCSGRSLLLSSGGGNWGAGNDTFSLGNSPLGS